MERRIRSTDPFFQMDSVNLLLDHGADVNATAKRWLHSVDAGGIIRS